MSDNYYISSLVAKTAPCNLNRIRSVIEQFPFTEVPSASDNGNMVILIDAPSMKDLLTTTDQIREVEGIHSLLPVYQHEETNQQPNNHNTSKELETTQ